MTVRSLHGASQACWVSLRVVARHRLVEDSSAGSALPSRHPLRGGALRWTEISASRIRGMLTSPPSRRPLPRVWRALLLRLFVDNPALHCAWHCHRLPERSFFVANRQFHICSRCTGIFTGLLALPAAYWLAPIAAWVLGVTTFLNAIDGGTQLVGWRESNNLLRFILGLGFGIGLVATAAAIVKGGLHVAV